MEREERKERRLKRGEDKERVEKGTELPSPDFTTSIRLCFSA